jgi:hypothetical protein
MVQNMYLYQLALLATDVQRFRGFVMPIQAFDSTRIYNAIIPAPMGSMSQDFRVLVLKVAVHLSAVTLNFRMAAHYS